MFLTLNINQQFGVTEKIPFKITLPVLIFLWAQAPERGVRKSNSKITELYLFSGTPPTSHPVPHYLPSGDSLNQISRKSAGREQLLRF